MDHWDNHNHRLRNRKDNHRHPSFSSTLLDQIYRSIDDNNNSDVSMKTLNHHKQQHHHHHHPVIPRDFVRSAHHSSSSSSDSSGFSSSESDSFYKRSRSENFHHHPKPIRTTVVEKSPQISHHRPNNKQEHGSFLRTKSKALKIYSDLKKVKQPISPGTGRLSTFLNSIFTGNTKKPTKINTTVVDSSTTTCSSASSFSRSCLSKTPSSSEKSKRSVRFLDESHNNNNERESNRNNRFVDESHHNERESNRNNRNLEIRVMEENRRVIEAAKELLRNYQKNKDVVAKISGEEEEEEDDDDDAASCASSDLFELDNLSAIGIGKYREELPVYETTRLNTNRIISR